MKIDVPNTQGPTPIIDYCIEAIPVLGSRSAVKRAIAKESLFLNGRLAVFKDKVRGGDTIEYEQPQQRKVKKLDLPLDIVYEDEHMVVVNKPGGIAVNGLRHKTVENILADFNRGLDVDGALDRPIAVHRIDVPTCGLVILARSKQALIRLSKKFEDRHIQKEYTAVVHGRASERGIIDTSIKGQSAETRFERMDTGPSKIFGHLSMLKVMPVTGRTHQIRIHLTGAGHLIVGDKQYAEGKRTILGKGVLLCASRLQFEHPITGHKMDIKARVPGKFQKVLDRERERF